MRHAFRRCSNFVRNLRDFCRADEETYAPPVDANAVLASMIAAAAGEVRNLAKALAASGSLAVVAINGRESFNHFGSPALRSPSAYLLGSSGRR